MPYRLILELWFGRDTAPSQDHSLYKVSEHCSHVDLIILQLDTSTPGLDFLH